MLFAFFPYCPCMVVISSWSIFYFCKLLYFFNWGVYTPSGHKFFIILNYSMFELLNIHTPLKNSNQLQFWKKNSMAQFLFINSSSRNYNFNLLYFAYVLYYSIHSKLQIVLAFLIKYIVFTMYLDIRYIYIHRAKAVLCT